MSAGLCVAGLGLAAWFPAAGGTGTVAESLARALVPYGLLGLVVVWARSGRTATWTAFVGTLLTLVLGAALYARALGPEAHPGAPALALSFVPLRQTAAAAVTATLVSLARRAHTR